MAIEARIELKAVLDPMLHFTKQHVAVLRLHGGSRGSRSLARFRCVALHECGDERCGGGQKLDRVLTEIARVCAVDLQHAPGRSCGQHRDVDQRHNMVLPQQVREDEILLLIEVPDVDRFGGLERASGRRPQIGRQRCGADDTFLPSETGSDEQVCFPAAIPQHLDMSDLHGPRDLHHGLIEKTVQIRGFARSPAEVDQDPHVPADFLQFRRLFTDRGIVHPGSTLAARNGARGHGLQPKETISRNASLIHSHVGQQTFIIRSDGWRQWMVGARLHDSCPQSSMHSTASNAFATSARATRAGGLFITITGTS